MSVCKSSVPGEPEKIRKINLIFDYPLNPPTLADFVPLKLQLY